MIAFAPTLLLAAAAYSNLTWRSIGPAVAGGRVAGVAGTPQNDQLYYLGTAGGGVWKSDNGGATWKPVFDKQSVSAIGAVAIDPTQRTRRLGRIRGSQPAQQRQLRRRSLQDDRRR